MSRTTAFSRDANQTVYSYKGGRQRRARFCLSVCLSTGGVDSEGRIALARQTPSSRRAGRRRQMPCPTVPLDTSRLQKFATEGVPRGDADAQMRLGHMHYCGRDGSRNFLEARRLYQLSAAQGNAEAQATLGQMMYRGEGGPPQDVEARRLCGLAAAQGHCVAITLLGTMHYDGRGGPRDFEEARRVLGLATAQGHCEALAWLGTMHYRGEGGPVDYTEARVLLAQAAELVDYPLHMHRMITACAPHDHRMRTA